MKGSAGVRAALALFVVVVLVLVALALPRVRDFEAFLSGFWVGDPAFLREAGLSELYLYLAPAEEGGGRRRRQGYLVLGGDDRVLSNQGIELSYADAGGRAWSALKGGASAAASASYRIKGVSVGYDEEAAMPESLDLVLDTTRGALVLHSGGKAWLKAYKDNENSAWANAAFLSTSPPAPPPGPAAPI
jgi:hypothetical protein